MRCYSPRTVGYKSDGKTLCWSSKNYSKEYATFQLPCGKCIECRLEYARTWAIRCVHESICHQNNVFITLTYSDQNLPSDRKLHYDHFQKFMKRLRKEQHEQFLLSYGFDNWRKLGKEGRKAELKRRAISYFVTGEYGDQTKRPHWHAIIFNWSPTDLQYLRTTDRGDRVYKSKQLDDLWGYNDFTQRPNEIGDVTFESAGYVARYAAKKLVHGNDDAHDFKPISKKSSANAIGKRFLERFWTDIFNHGKVVLPDGRTIGTIPRYYEKWLAKNHPEAYRNYLIKTKADKSLKAIEQENAIKLEEKIINSKRVGSPQISRIETAKRLAEQRLQQLNSHQKET